MFSSGQHGRRGDSTLVEAEHGDCCGQRGVSGSMSLGDGVRSLEGKEGPQTATLSSGNNLSLALHSFQSISALFHWTLIVSRGIVPSAPGNGGSELAAHSYTAGRWPGSERSGGGPHSCDITLPSEQKVAMLEYKCLFLGKGVQLPRTAWDDGDTNWKKSSQVPLGPLWAAARCPRERDAEKEGCALEEAAPAWSGWEPPSRAGQGARGRSCALPRLDT